MSSEELLAACAAAFGEVIRGQHCQAGDAAVTVIREDVPVVFRTLRDDPRFAFNLIVDVTAVDYLGRTPRFEVVYHLLSLVHNHRLRVKIPVGDDDPVVPSLVPLWKGAIWLEREVWDMFGIRFSDHPDLRRILLYPAFEGHPLRKDYPVDRRQPLVPERDPIESPWKGR